MDRRSFLGLTAGGFLGLGQQPKPGRSDPELDEWLNYDWIADIQSGGRYKLLKTVPRVDLVHLSPPERGGSLRLDFIDWDTYPEGDAILLVPVTRPNPEWHVLGPGRHSMSLWMGPRPRGEAPTALIEFESPTPVSVYAFEEKVQQLVLLTGTPDGRGK